MMADNQDKPHETPNSDMNNKPDNAPKGFNPTRREQLRQAADDILKANRAEQKAAEAFAKQAEAETEQEPLDLDALLSNEALSVVADEVRGLQTENAELKDRVLRMAADMENLRRRTQREVNDAKSFAIANFARDMLGVSDNLRRALEAVTPEQRESADDTLKNLLEGVELTERAMLSTMERNGVRQLAPEGEKFDPNFHQAMFEVPNTEVPNNTVVQVVQAGYSIGERVLRPAMVGVSKGGPKAAPSAPAEPVDSDPAGDA